MANMETMQSDLRRLETSRSSTGLRAASQRGNDRHVYRGPHRRQPRDENDRNWAESQHGFRARRQPSGPNEVSEPNGSSNDANLPYRNFHRRSNSRSSDSVASLSVVDYDPAHGANNSNSQNRRNHPRLAPNYTRTVTITDNKRGCTSPVSTVTYLIYFN